MIGRENVTEEKLPVSGGEISGLIDRIQKELEVQKEALQLLKVKIDPVIGYDYALKSEGDGDPVVSMETQIGESMASILSKIEERNKFIYNMVDRVRI